MVLLINGEHINRDIYVIFDVLIVEGKMRLGINECVYPLLASRIRHP